MQARKSRLYLRGYTRSKTLKRWCFPIMARDEDTCAYVLKLCSLVYVLPSQAIAEAFFLVLGAYVTMLNWLRNLAADDSQDELNSEMVFQQPGLVEHLYNYTDNFTGTELFGDNYTFTVSNALLWVCREGSPDGDFYRSLYRMAIGLLITFHLLTGFGRFFTQRFWHVYNTSEDDGTTTISRSDKDHGIAFITIVGAILLNLSFLFLLLSFDISPWSCLSKPSTFYVEYIPFSNRFDIQIQHSPSAITFQKVASILSLVLALCWVIARILFFCYDLLNDNIDDRLDDFGDAPDTGSADRDQELLEVNIEETEQQDSELNVAS